MESSNEKYGLTGPVTLKESSQEAIEKSKEIRQYLLKSDFFESEESAQLRERVLGKLDFMVKRFVQRMSPDGANCGGKIFTFGSYRLGVHDKGADIDALCVVPRHVTRKDFFTHFYEDLKSTPEVSELSKVEEAYVPIMSLKFQEIPIDLLFARIPIPAVKESINLLNDSILRNMDEKCILSLNGSRVTDAMLNLVPNTAVFHDSLRAIKFWAKRRYVYGNSFGYFGGVAFSISTARICQMYPNFSAFDIVCKFFECYASWKWPNPVMLKQIVDHNYNLKVWDPKIHPADKYHKMPVITPAYPSICSTHNMTQSTFTLMVAELQRANTILKTGENFFKIFDFTDFFKKYKIFIEIKIAAAGKDRLLSWCGYIESKVRILATKLETIDGVTSAIPFPKAFKVKVSGDSSEKLPKESIQFKEGGGENEIKKTLVVGKADVFDGLTSDASKVYLNDKTKREDIKEIINKQVLNNGDPSLKDLENKVDSSVNECNGLNYKDTTLNDNSIGSLSENNKDFSSNRKETNENYKRSGKDENSPINQEEDRNGSSKVKLTEDDQRKAFKLNENPEASAFKMANSLEDCNEEVSECRYFIAIEVFINKTTEKKLYVDGPIKEFLDFVNSWDSKDPQMKIEINSRKKKEVQTFIREFYKE